MTKQEAIQAMREGKKVTHRWFSPNEWITIINNNTLLLEDGITISLERFFVYRTAPSWGDGYSLFE